MSWPEGKMNRFRVTIMIAAMVAVFSPLLIGCATASTKETKALTISESNNGDGLVVAATGQVEADLAHLRVLVQHAVVRAIRSLRPLTPTREMI